MKNRIALCALACAAAAGPVQAQAVPEARTSVGLAVGPAFTTSWFTQEGRGFHPGLSATVGLVARQQVTPRFAARLHGAYTWTDLPKNTDVDPGKGVNTYLYDLAAEYRPLAASRTPSLARGYVFLGGGAVTTNIPGEPRAPGGVGYACASVYRPRGACVIFVRVTKPAVAAGFGSDFARLGDRLSAFGEYGLHGYQSPSLELASPTEGKFTLTHRLSLGLRARVR
jgi:hypothetical protein